MLMAELIIKRRIQFINSYNLYKIYILSRRMVTASVDSAKVKKQIEYYLSDNNLRNDEFFHNKISANAEVSDTIILLSASY